MKPVLLIHSYIFVFIMRKKENSYDLKFFLEFCVKISFFLSEKKTQKQQWLIYFYFVKLDLVTFFVVNIDIYLILYMKIPS